MARRTDGGVRFRPVGSSRHPRTPVRYSPGGTGCPAIEQAIEQLYHGQNDQEHCIEIFQSYRCTSFC